MGPLHARLTTPVLEKGRIVSQVVHDLTAYLVGPTVEEFDFIIDLYRRICPPDRLEVYAMAETLDWDLVASPILTKHGQAAADRGLELPFCEVVRRRILEGRAFELQFWDAMDTDSYSLNVRRVKLEDRGEKHAFVRFILPLTADVALLRTIATELAESVDLRSGHGGLCLSYDPWEKYRGFTINYGRAKRWWGLDLEDLNGTLPLMVERVKGPQWITILGDRFRNHPDVAPRVEPLGPSVSITTHRYGTVLVAGDTPVAGDRHLPDPGLDAYFEVGSAIAAITVDEHPDFIGESFLRYGNTLGWFRRFIEPEGWQ